MSDADTYITNNLFSGTYCSILIRPNSLRISNNSNSNRILLMYRVISLIRGN